MTDSFVSMRIDATRADKMRTLAQLHQRSLAGEVRVALDQYIAAHADELTPPRQS